jgi:ABC-type Fe3+/spermidine/putrescine transport system ATPase subunit
MRMRGAAREAVAAAVERALTLVRLEGLPGRYASELSGGQRQRVALARALIIQPDILLLDEPLAALDRKLREGMQLELKRIQRETGITTIIVTHDQEEALSLADRVAVMFEGRIAELGAPGEIYLRPKSRTVITFLGAANLFEGRVVRTDGDRAALACANGITLYPPIEPRAMSEALAMGIRPEHVVLHRATDGDASSATVAGVVREIVYKGVSLDVYVAVGDRLVSVSLAGAKLADRGAPVVGETVHLAFPAQHLVLALAQAACSVATRSAQPIFSQNNSCRCSAPRHRRSGGASLSSPSSYEMVRT